MKEYFLSILDSVVSALPFWVLLAYSMHKDRSRYRNCTFFMLAALWTLPVLASFTGPLYAETMTVFILVLFVVILLLPFILIINGFLMLAHEGLSLKNLLSLLLGVMIEIGEISTFAFILIEAGGFDDVNMEGIFHEVPKLLLFISLSMIYVSMSFYAFALYTKFLEVIPRKRDFDYVIVLGAGLLRGEQVSKLLADRLDKAIEIYSKDPTPPQIITSGGQGKNETISEAAAMKKYLLEKGIPEEKIILEDQSKTTRENLVNSKAILDAQEGRKYVAVVTSNYHVYRALRICRKINLKSVGIGGHVAAYYWPSAMIREYIAVHSEKKHIFLWTAGWVITSVLPVFLLYFLQIIAR